MKQLVMIVSFCLLVIPGSDMLVCKLNAPSGAANGVWPGSVIVLNCTILQDGPVEYITWKKDGDLLRNTSLVSHGKSSALMWEGLKLDDLSDKDDGQYSCVAFKGDHSQEDWYTLHLFAKPHIIRPRLSELELRFGDRFSIMCSATGWPKPNITWTKDGKEYKESSRVFKSVFGVTLRFSFARLTDRGFYMCHANNSVGSDIRPVLVDVKPVLIRKRSLKVTTPYQKITVYENQNISLECRATDIVEKFTIPFWELNGKRLEDSGEDHQFEGTNCVLFWYKITNVTLKDAGSYKCHVLTHEGNDSQVIWLNVEKRGPPRLSSKNPTVLSKLGSSATLSCALKYADSADVIMKWTHNHRQSFYSDSGHHNIEDKDPKEGSIVYSLLIRNVTVEDLGCYNCEVNTSLGSSSQLVCLQLKQNKKEILTIYASSSSAVPLWKTTVPVFLVCLVVCVAGFIAGFYARRNRYKRPGFQDTSDPRATDGYQYDVFITFSSKDFHWVKTQLIPLIEKQNLNYCIHNRDFQPGKPIVDNMADSIYNSRRILAVLSKNYMSSTFCRGELDMALYRNTLLKDSSLIAIRVDEIEKKRLPKALQGKTFLDIYKDQEKNLWEIRLAKQLALEEEENSL